MLEFFARLLDPVGFPPRWQCGLWSSGLGWLHIVSDVAIFAAYFTIPVLLVVLVWRRRRDIPFNGVFLLFAAFIVACGSGHLIEASMFWNPVYRLSGLVKAVTAVVSWLTVLALVPALRKALTLRTPTQLEAEVALRTMELQESRELLERRVDERTEAYRQSNEDLERFAYVASHDLQEPLRMVSGYMELLEDEHVEQLDDDAREYVRYAADGARRMQVLLDDLLAYSRAQSRELVPEPIAAEEAFEAALDKPRAAHLGDLGHHHPRSVAGRLVRPHAARAALPESRLQRAAVREGGGSAAGPRGRAARRRRLGDLRAR
ncbi:MAG: hypothetical protein SangKO_090100 [Sandaracinaceae bacterium]